MSILESFKIKEEDNIIAAVSGGPDSMALLDMLVKEGFKPIICHVNYHKRETSNRDEQIVRRYASTHNLIIEVLNATDTTSGNFQNWAREFRYNFFKRIYNKYNACALIVAHHQDDALETYLFKKMRNSVGESLTIRNTEHIYNMLVIRPLLDLTKKELRDYCENNHIEFGDDESNFEEIYTRNSIRLGIVDQLSPKEYQQKVLMMKKEEALWQEKRNKVISKVNDSIEYSEFKKFSMDEKKIFLYAFITKKCPELAKKLTGNHLEEIINKFSSKKANLKVILINNWYIVKNYDVISIINDFKQDYSYQITEMVELKTEYFELSLTGNKMEGIYVDSDDFPLTIRPARSDDFINLKKGHKYLNRLFIDKKIPLWQRDKWPVVVNKNGVIILVPGIYRLYERKDLQNSIFVLKYTNVIER